MSYVYKLCRKKPKLKVKWWNPRILYIYFFKWTKFSYQTKTIFLEKKNAAARLATISATCWTGNNLFLRVALDQRIYSY